MARTHRGVPIRSADELVKARHAAQLAADSKKWGAVAKKIGLGLD